MSASLRVRGRAGAFSGRGRAPSDKSITHRALILGALAEGATRIRDALHSADTLATRVAVERLGATVESEEGELVVRGGIRPQDSPIRIDCADSGTTARLLLGVLAGCEGGSFVLDGSASLRRRPMRRVARSLEAMGARIEGGEGLPLRIRGSRLLGADHSIPVASAQWKSALLLAGWSARGVTRVTEPLPSRDHTERMLPSFGVPVDRRGTRASVAGPARLFATTVDVPSDPSSAIFLGAAAIVTAGEFVAEDVGVNPTRTGAFPVLREMGAVVEISDPGATAGEPRADVRFGGGPLAGVDVPPEAFPSLVDEVPVLAAVAAVAEGRTRFFGIGELRGKESDRVATVVEMITAFGGRAEAAGDALTVHGGRRLRSADLDPRGDHRIAMAAAVLALAAEGDSLIRAFGCADQSFPGFANWLGRSASATA